MFGLGSGKKKPKKAEEDAGGKEGGLVLEVVVSKVKDEADASRLTGLVEANLKSLVDTDAFGPCTAADVVKSESSTEVGDTSKVADEDKGGEEKTEGATETKVDEDEKEETEGPTDTKADEDKKEGTNASGTTSAGGFTVSFQITLANETSETFPGKQAPLTAAIAAKQEVDNVMLPWVAQA